MQVVLIRTFAPAAAASLMACSADAMFAALSVPQSIWHAATENGVVDCPVLVKVSLMVLKSVELLANEPGTLTRDDERPTLQGVASENALDDDRAARARSVTLSGLRPMNWRNLIPSFNMYRFLPSTEDSRSLKKRQGEQSIQEGARMRLTGL